jgi:hypothetical protein
MVCSVLSYPGFSGAYLTPCASGYNDCDHNESNGCETAVDADVMDCGDAVQCARREMVISPLATKASASTLTDVWCQITWWNPMLPPHAS